MDRINLDYDELQREYEGDWDGHEDEITFESVIDSRLYPLAELEPVEPQYPLSEAGKAYQERIIREASEK